MTRSQYAFALLVTAVAILAILDVAHAQAEADAEAENGAMAANRDPALVHMLIATIICGLLGRMVN